MEQPDEFEVIAISRDLSRRPAVKVLAVALARLNGVVVNKDDLPPPLYIMLAFRILTHKAERTALLHLIDLITED